MMELSSFMVLMIAMFGVIGFMRGWTKELIATAGIVLALFTLKQFETLFIDPLTDGKQNSKFFLQAAILIVMAFLAYHTPPERLVRTGRRTTSNREGIQDGILGALVGMWNGYLLIGSLWWYMDNLEYPLSPHITPVIAGTASANWVDILPLSWLLGGDGGLLSLLMIALFVFVIAVVI
jgi:uncharacterized membrane protein required for colicin V production